MKKFLALLLAAMMVLSLAACTQQAADPTSAPSAGGENSTAPDPAESQEVYENKIVIGDITEMSGDFRSPGWGTSSANATDQAVWFLTAGYAAMETDRDRKSVV